MASKSCPLCSNIHSLIPGQTTLLGLLRDQSLPLLGCQFQVRTGLRVRKCRRQQRSHRKGPSFSLYPAIRSHYTALHWFRYTALTGLLCDERSWDCDAFTSHCSESSVGSGHWQHYQIVGLAALWWPRWIAKAGGPELFSLWASRLCGPWLRDQWASIPLLWHQS